MNYSASEDYDQKLAVLEKRRIKPEAIRRRLFRNHYVLYRTSGYFKRLFLVMVAEFDTTGDHGDFYGPFRNAKKAEDFGNKLVALHDSFILS